MQHHCCTDGQGFASQQCLQCLPVHSSVGAVVSCCKNLMQALQCKLFAALHAHCFGTVTQVQPVFGNPIVHSSAGAIMARFNISKDAIYFPAGKRKGDKLGGGSRLHTVQAINMSSIPLGIVTRAEMFHRPLGLWNPLLSKKFHIKGQDKLQSMHPLQYCFHSQSVFCIRNADNP